MKGPFSKQGLKSWFMHDLPSQRLKGIFEFIASQPPPWPLGSLDWALLFSPTLCCYFYFVIKTPMGSLV